MVAGSIADFLQAMTILGAMAGLGFFLWSSMGTAEQRKDQSAAQALPPWTRRVAASGRKLLLQSAGPRAQTRPAAKPIDAPQGSSSAPSRPHFEGSPHDGDAGVRRRG
jgi:hypothetical protein